VQSREHTWLESGVHERVCASLARIIDGLTPPASGDLVITATHESLAARCGVSRPRLSRELKQLEESGRLRLRRGTIEVLDRAWFEQHWL
jgi:CRP-like cAMP-binding protein